VPDGAGRVSAPVEDAAAEPNLVRGAVDRFDTLIIGSGPAGEGAAMKLAKSGGGWRWSSVTPGRRWVHALGHHSEQGAASVGADARGLPPAPLFQSTGRHLSVSYPDLLRGAQSVIHDQVKTRHRHYGRNGVAIIEGSARSSASTPSGQPPEADQALRGEGRSFVATGSHPYHPDIDFAHPARPRQRQHPEPRPHPRIDHHLTAPGHRCEYARCSPPRRPRFNLVQYTATRLLSFLRRRDHGRAQLPPAPLGVSSATTRPASGSRRWTTRRAALPLGQEVQVGRPALGERRTGTTAGLGLEALGIAVNSRGQVEVDDRFRTALPHVYAVGDVVGPPALASASYDQGRFAATLIADGDGDWRLVEAVPTASTRAPRSARSARPSASSRPRRCPTRWAAHLRQLARAQITGHTVGVLKLLFHRETLALLGIHCFGEDAAEIIPHRAGRDGARAAGQLDRLLRRHDVQLPHHGGGLSGRRAQWAEPAVLSPCPGCASLLQPEGAVGVLADSMRTRVCIPSSER